MGHRRRAHWRRPPGSSPGASKTVYVRDTNVKDPSGSGDDGGGACACCLLVIVGLIFGAGFVVEWVKDLIN